jgi:hypothetical protein
LRGPRGGDIALEGGERGRDGGAGEIFLLVTPADGAGEEPKPVALTGGLPLALRGDVAIDSRTGERERGLLGGGGGENGLADPLLGGEPPILPLFLGGDPGLLDSLARGDLESRRLGDGNRGGVDERRLLIGDLKGERDPRLGGSGDLGLMGDLSLRSPLRKSLRRSGDLDLIILLGERDLSRLRTGDRGVGERLLETGRIGERVLARTGTTRSATTRSDTTRSVGWAGGDCLDDGLFVAERGGLPPLDRSLLGGGVLSRLEGGDLSLDLSLRGGSGEGERRL